MQHYIFNHRYLFIGGMLSLIGYAYLSVQSRFYGDANLTQTLGVLFFCAVVAMVVWLKYWHAQQSMPLLVVVGFAVLYRLIGVSAFPLLEDDIFRYLWDGRMTVLTGSPYGVAPAEFFQSDHLSAQFEQILGLVNYPSIATVYGPLNQWVFAGSYLVAPGELWPLQLFYALADICLILILSKLAKPLFVMLYAWSPLMIKEFAFTAHPDVLGALLLVIAYYAYQRDRFIWVGCLVALAAGVKIFALLLLPILFGFRMRAWISFMTTLLILSYPWGFLAAWFPQGLQAMGDGWLFNAPVYFILNNWLPVTKIQTVMFILLASGYAFYYVFVMRQWKLQHLRADLLFVALFLCMPVFNVWYMVWLLPFAVLYPSVGVWAASVSVLMAYIIGLNLSEPSLQAYQQPVWAVSLEFGFIIIAIILARLIKPYMTTLNPNRNVVRSLN